MRLQLWTTADDGFGCEQTDQFLGEVDVDDQEWYDAQADAGSALDLIQELASEVGTDDD